MASPTINSMTSFSGADLVVTFASQPIGELQQISWGVQREKAPVFTLGSADPRSFSRGKRGIAGSLVFAVFDTDTLAETMKKVWDQIAPPAMFTAAGNKVLARSENMRNAFEMTRWNQTVKASIFGEDKTYNPYSWVDDNGNPVSIGFMQDEMGDILGSNYGSINPASAGAYGFTGTGEITNLPMPGSDGKPVMNSKTGFVQGFGTAEDVYVPPGFDVIRGDNVVYADTLPPFDATLTFANEYGQCAFKKIYDIDILNEASGVSTDSIVMEQQFTYIARRLSPLVKGIYSRETGGRLRERYPTDARS